MGMTPSQEPVMTTRMQLAEVLEEPRVALVQIDNKDILFPRGIERDDPLAAGVVEGAGALPAAWHRPSRSSVS
jgi:hypothetical protein